MLGAHNHAEFVAPENEHRKTVSLVAMAVEQARFPSFSRAMSVMHDGHDPSIALVFD